MLNKTDLDEAGVSKIFRELAMNQLNSIAAREVFARFSFKSPALQSDDLDKPSLQEVSKALYDRVIDARESLNPIDKEDWFQNFHRLCEENKKSLQNIWEVKWKELCNGKQLFQEFQKQGILKASYSDFKRKIMQAMKDNASENWRVLQSLMKENLEA